MSERLPTDQSIEVGLSLCGTWARRLRSSNGSDGTGSQASRVRLSQDVFDASSAREFVESQKSLSHLLRAETEPTAQTQATNSGAKSLPFAVPEAVNQVWSADFMSDALWNGKRFRPFNVIDDFNREALAVEIDSGISAQRVVRILDQIAVWRGLPKRIRFDNGPELTALAVADWAEENGVALEFIKPGRPMQNGFIERFNQSNRESSFEYVYL
jgi:transposase InsO family protein